MSAFLFSLQRRSPLTIAVHKFQQFQFRYHCDPINATNLEDGHTAVDRFESSEHSRCNGHLRAAWNLGDVQLMYLNF